MFWLNAWTFNGRVSSRSYHATDILEMSKLYKNDLIWNNPGDDLKIKLFFILKYFNCKFPQTHRSKQIKIDCVKAAGRKLHWSEGHLKVKFRKRILIIGVEIVIVGFSIVNDVQDFIHLKCFNYRYSLATKARD